MTASTKTHMVNIDPRTSDSFTSFRGGRMTKVNGKVASIAPSLFCAPSTAGCLLSSVAVGLALSTTAPLAIAGSCDFDTAVGPDFLCSGPPIGVGTTQSYNGGAVNLTAEDGFSLYIFNSFDVGIDISSTGPVNVDLSNTGQITTRSTSLRINSAGDANVKTGVMSSDFGNALSLSAAGDIDLDTRAGILIGGLGPTSPATAGIWAGGPGVSNLFFGKIFSPSGGIGLDGAENITRTNNVYLDDVTVVYGGYALTISDRGGSWTNVIDINGDVELLDGGLNPWAIRLDTSPNTKNTLILNDGAYVTGPNGNAIIESYRFSITDIAQSETTVVMNTGSDLAGRILLFSGSDRFEIAGGTLSNITTLDGGDDASLADGYIDVIAVTNDVDFALTGTPARAVNWERFDVLASAQNVGATFLSTGDGSAGTGTFVRDGGTLMPNAGVTADSQITVDAGGIFDASAAGIVVNSDVTNNGTVTLANGSAGDTLTVNGNYGGVGILELDSVLADDASATDKLIVAGDYTATSTLYVNNIGGAGDVTLLGIPIISVGGANSGSVALVGDFTTATGEQAVVGGAYAYTLQENPDGSLALVSELIPVVVEPPVVEPPVVEPPVVEPPVVEPPIVAPPVVEPPVVEPPIVAPPVVEPTMPLYQPGASIYESYAQNLLALDDVLTLRQRRGNSGDASGGSATSQTPAVWLRTSGSTSDLAPNNSTTLSAINTDTFKLHAGVEYLAMQSEAGSFYIGANFNYGTSSSDVTSLFGGGSIDTEGYGIGLTATWMAKNGFYLDGQANFSRYTSDLSSDILGTLISDNDGSGLSLSLEAGKRFATSIDGLNLIPQAQLSYSSVDFDDFVGPNGERVQLTDASRTNIRLGLEAAYVVNSAGGRTGDFYGIANAHYTMDNASTVNISGIDLESTGDGWYGEIGFGGQFNVTDKINLYGEASYLTDFDNAGDNGQVSASLGLRIAF